MVEKADNPFLKFVGKQVKVFFDDGSSVRYKPAILEDFNSEFLFLKVGNESEAIAVSKIIRIEFEGDEKL